MQTKALTAAGSVLIYRFVCHPGIAHVSPTIVYVTSVLIPAKPEDDGEVLEQLWRYVTGCGAL